MAAHPILIASTLVAAFGSEVNIVVGGVEQIDAPRIRGIGVEYVTILVFEKYADSGVLQPPGFCIWKL